MRITNKSLLINSLDAHHLESLVKDPCITVSIEGFYITIIMISNFIALYLTMIVN